MNIVPSYPLSFLATSENFSVPIITINQNFAETSTRLVSLEDWKSSAESRLAVLEAGLASQDARLDDLESNGLSLPGMSLFRVLLTPLGCDISGRGTSIDGKVSLSGVSLASDWSLSKFEGENRLPGLNFLHVGEVEGVLSLRVSQSLSVPSSMTNSVIAGVCCVSPGGYDVGAGLCAGGIYRGYLGGVGAAKSITLANNTEGSVSLGLGAVAHGMRARVVVSTTNRWNTLAQVSIVGYVYDDAISEPGQAVSGTAPTLWIHSFADDNGAIRLYNKSGASRTLYVSPESIHLPLCYTV